MEEFIKIDLKKEILYLILAVVFTVLMVASIMYVTDASNMDSHTIELDDGWEVMINNKKYENVTLSTFKFDMCNKGDVIVLRHAVPRYDSVQQPTLELFTVHSAVKVALDDEVIYLYGQSEYHESKLLGYGKHFVPIPSDSMSKWLNVELLVSENNAFNGIQAMKISDGNTMFRREISGKRINFAIALFLIVFGLIAMISAVFMIKKGTNFEHIFCIAMLSFLVGCWTFCIADLIEYMTSDLLVKVYLEYMSFYLFPIPFTYYFRDRIEEDGTPKWLRCFFWGLITAELIHVASACILQFTNIRHLPAMLTGEHIIMLCIAAFVIIINMRDIKLNRKHSNSVIVGFGIAILIALIELIRFDLSKYIVGFANNEYSSATYMAVLIIVISLLVDYGSKISQALYENVQKSILEQMAYMDELTGLGNRRACERKLQQLAYNENPKKHPYAVISFDLNFLKKANDTYGHEKGDELIRNFSQLIREVFEEYGLVARTGGDEFTVVLEESSKVQVDKLLNRMLLIMEEKNKKRADIKLSAAYGYALSNEEFSQQELMGRAKIEVSKINPHVVYRIADDRMYENKRKSRLGR